jgi:hypothetical protein
MENQENDEEIFGMGDIEQENESIDDLETENIYLTFIGIDQSGSMTQYIGDMKKALSEFKDALTNSKESDEILIARGNFSDSVELSGYKKITELNTEYKTGGVTKLYDMCVEGADKLIKYIDYLRPQGMRVRAVFSIFSDGHDLNSKYSLYDAKQALEKLKKYEITLAFISFGQDAISEAKNLGFKKDNILEVGASASELRKAFNCLSKSVIESSKSVVDNQGFFNI